MVILSTTQSWNQSDTLIALEIEPNQTELIKNWKRLVLSFGFDQTTLPLGSLHPQDKHIWSGVCIEEC